MKLPCGALEMERNVWKRYEVLSWRSKEQQEKKVVFREGNKPQGAIVEADKHGNGYSSV